jgi:hypothetical protein
MGDPRLAFAIVASIIVPPHRVLSEKTLRRRSETWQVTSARIDRMLLRNIYGLWMLNIEYSYSADQKYEGLRLVRYVRRKAAEGVAARFATGSSTIVRYNPAHPEQSVLLIDDPHDFRVPRRVRHV